MLLTTDDLLFRSPYDLLFRSPLFETSRFSSYRLPSGPRFIVVIQNQNNPPSATTSQDTAPTAPVDTTPDATASSAYRAGQIALGVLAASVIATLVVDKALTMRDLYTCEKLTLECGQEILTKAFPHITKLFTQLSELLPKLW